MVVAPNNESYFEMTHSEILDCINEASTIGGMIKQDDQAVETAIYNAATWQEKVDLALKRLPTRILLAAAQGRTQAQVYWFSAEEGNAPADLFPLVPDDSWLPRGTAPREFYEACKAMGLGPYISRSNRGCYGWTAGFMIDVNVTGTFPSTRKRLANRKKQGVVEVTIKNDCSIGE